ncbi:MAG: GvpL/GvpF family gas vesicle protein [Nanoarchaeota archaeon]|nr:GvpL/GvpF family gas vesicle protein [Nanoarchaeota archaeon]
MEERIYVYCIIPLSEKKQFGNIGIDKNPVYAMDYKDVSVVVSDCSDLNPQPSEENAKIHENVIKEIMINSNSVVPMAFGMIFANEKILKSIIKTTYKAVKEILNTVEGKLELGVRIITKGGMENRDGISDEIFSILKEKSEETKKGNLFSDRLVLNGCFLVKKDKIGEFSNTVEELESKYPDLKFHYSGPWAPYNFVKINIGANK